LDLGHRDIIFYFFEYDRSHYSVSERRAGFEAALVEAGIDPSGRFWRHEKAEDAAPLFAAKRLPTGVVCYSHFESLAVTHGMWSRGVRVPEDISVVGFNDLTAMRYLTPPLTTIRFDTNEIGRLGADLLVKQIESEVEYEPQKITLKEQLIVRGSTGPPRTGEVVVRRR
jgi:DNA-binding LacI/PurR family transcriptional regulator